MHHLATFYQFLSLDELPLKRERALARAAELELKGTILLAAEGINAALCGSRDSVDAMLAWLESKWGVQPPFINRQMIDQPAFRRLKVRIRPEIIRFDQPWNDHVPELGEHLTPAEWNRLLDQPGLRLVDTRNDYEVGLGSFEGAENPHIDSFTEFARWAEEHLDPAEPVAMFCTGGVRCEKASAWLKARGFQRVYQLAGGILNYLDQVPSPQSRWRGECFVFDDRISLDHQLQPTDRPVCQACRKPCNDIDDDRLPPLDQNRRCIPCGQLIEQKHEAGMRERARQIRIARERGGQHLA